MLPGIAVPGKPCPGARPPAAPAGAVVVTTGVTGFFGITMDMGTISAPSVPAAGGSPAPANAPVALPGVEPVPEPPPHAASSALTVIRLLRLLFMIPRLPLCYVVLRARIVNVP